MGWADCIRRQLIGLRGKVPWVAEEHRRALLIEIDRLEEIHRDIEAVESEVTELEDLAAMLEELLS